MENKNDYKYDVFISYSRKDYVDENKKVIPGNIVSQIKEALDTNKISYWMDEKGIYSGDEFAKTIAKFIRQSKIFLFISTENSNASEWTSDEIATARMYKKKIIPFKYDNSFYNEEVIIFIAKLDFIDYLSNPRQAINKLISSIKKYLADLEELWKREEELRLRKKQEEEERIKRAEEEARKELIRSEIKQKAQDCQLLILQQRAIIQQLHSKNISIGNESKVCPVCKKKEPIEVSFCDKCGFQFPLLYSIDGNEDYPLDNQHLAVAKANFDVIALVENEKKELKDKIVELTTSVAKYTKECEQYRNTIAQNNCELAAAQSQLKILNKQLDDKKQELNNRIDKLQLENAKLIKQIEQSEQEQRQVEKDFVEAQKKIKDLEVKLLSESQQQIESSLYTVLLVASGSQKLAVVKEIKEITNIGLKEAKDLVDNVPSILVDDISKDEAEKIKRRLRRYDAVVEIDLSKNAKLHLAQNVSLIHSNKETSNKSIFQSKSEIFNFVRLYSAFPSSLTKKDRINSIKSKSQLCEDLEKTYGIIIWSKISRIQTIGELVDFIWSKTKQL